MDKDLEIFCVTDKHLNFFNDIKYKLAAVGKNNFPSNYLIDFSKTSNEKLIQSNILLCKIYFHLYYKLYN